MEAPSEAALRARARPMPFEAPVMRRTLLARDIFGFFVVLGGGCLCMFAYGGGVVKKKMVSDDDGSGEREENKE